MGSEGSSNGVVVITTKTGKLGAPRGSTTIPMWVREGAEAFTGYDPTPQQQAKCVVSVLCQCRGTFCRTGIRCTIRAAWSVALPYWIIEGAGTNNLGVAQGSSPLADPSLYNYQNYRILKANQAGTNWWKTIFRPALTQNHEMTISGATR